MFPTWTPMPMGPAAAGGVVGFSTMLFPSDARPPRMRFRARPVWSTPMPTASPMGRPEV